MFVSAALTAFVLAALAAVVYAYQGMVSPTPTLQSAAAPASFNASTPMALAAPVQDVSPQDAAALAAKSMNRTDLFSVQLTQYQGAQAYKVTFSSGDVVYVDMTGQVLASVAAVAPAGPVTSGGLYSAPAKMAGSHTPKEEGSAGGSSGGGDDGGGDH